MITLEERGAILAAAGRCGRDEEEVRLVCPRCPPGKAPTLALNRRTGLFICFRCGDFKGRLGKPSPPSKRRTHPKPPERPEPTFSPDDLSPPLLNIKGFDAQRARRYLQRRGMSREEILEADVRLDGLRVAFPVRNREGTPVGYVARSFVDSNSGPKYLTPSWFGKSEHLYGAERLVEGRVAVLAEGVFDVIGGRRAVPEATWLGLLGSTISEAQVRLLVAAKPAFAIIMLDADAERKARDVARKVGVALPVLRAELPEEDPGSADPQIIRAVFAKLRPLSPVV
jgi:hypothetical protein